MLRKQELDDGRKKLFGKKIFGWKDHTRWNAALLCFLRLRLKRLLNRAKLLFLFFYKNNLGDMFENCVTSLFKYGAIGWSAKAVFDQKM